MQCGINLEFLRSVKSGTNTDHSNPCNVANLRRLFPALTERRVRPVTDTGKVHKNQAHGLKHSQMLIYQTKKVTI